MRKFIPLAAAQLRVAVCALHAFPTTKWLPYPWLAIECGWLLVWLWAYSVAVQAAANQACHVFLLFVLYWTSQVLKNTLHVTVAGAVGAWYFQGALAPADTVTLAFKRATTKSLGSICMGSLLVAVVKTARALVGSARAQAERGTAAVALCCIDCCLGVLDRALQYFNQYAFTRVALYGEPFTTAARRVVEMIKAKGLEALVRDDLIGNVLLLGCVIGGALSAVIACLIGVGSDATGGALVLTALLGFLVGFMAMQQATEIIQSATAAIFISYGTARAPQGARGVRRRAPSAANDRSRARARLAHDAAHSPALRSRVPPVEDPAVLARTHPDEYRLLTDAYTQFYPEAMGKQEQYGQGSLHV